MAMIFQSRVAVFCCLGVLLLAAGLRAAEKPPGDTVVYHMEGKNRVHVAQCRRLPKDPAERAKYKTMTLAEAEAKGLPLCSKCPGSDTPGKDKDKKDKDAGKFDSWVNPPRDEAQRETFKPDARAPLVALGSDGKLVYKPYTDKGDRVLDWSQCGYRRSETPIPHVPVVETLEPLAAEARQVGTMKYSVGPDSRARIQEALDKVAAKEPNAEGSRGAVLLKQGTYYLEGPLRVPSGVVLRGEGDGTDGTVLIVDDGNGTGLVIEVGTPGAKMEEVGTFVRIADAYVPSGSTHVTLDDSSSFKVGDFVAIKKTVNQKWIDDLGMGERLQHIRGGKEGEGKRPWKPESYQFRVCRQVTAIIGSQIVLDAMLPQSLSDEYGGGEVAKVSLDGLAREAGVESLRLVSNYDTSVTENKKDTNFKNYRSGIVVMGASDCWIRNCSVLHVSLAAVKVDDDTRHVTVRDVKCLEPVGPVRGGSRYAFSVGGGTLHLFYKCYSEDGRHDFAGGSRNQGPFAFVNCLAVRGEQSEPHHRWGTGFLYDRVTTKDGTLAAINRGDSGSGHGWAAANSMFWNCDAKSITVFDPETLGECNFAVGSAGKPLEEYDPKGLVYANTRAGYWGTPKEGKHFGYALMGNGYIESPDGQVKPESLFVQQLIDRIDEEQAVRVLEEPSSPHQEARR